MDYNYEKLIDEFCDYKNYSDSKRKTLKRIQDFIVEADLFNSTDATVLRDIITEKIKARTYSSIMTYSSILKNFCEWGLNEKGFDIKNFYSDKILKVKYMLEYCAKEHRVPSIDEQRLDGIIVTLEEKSNDDTHLYYSVLLRLYYEGMTTDELSHLRKSDVDMETRRIKDMNMSLKLYDAIKAYSNFSYVEDRSKIINLFDGSFIRDTSMYEDPSKRKTDVKIFYRKRINYIFDNRIRPMIGENISCSDVYNNGFVSYIENRCGQDETINLFIDKYPKGHGQQGTRLNQLRKKLSDLEELGKEYRIIQSGSKIRNVFYPYVISRYNL